MTLNSMNEADGVNRIDLRRALRRGCDEVILPLRAAA